jgi:hypothetical protein
MDGLEMASISNFRIKKQFYMSKQSNIYDLRLNNMGSNAIEHIKYYHPQNPVNEVHLNYVRVNNIEKNKNKFDLFLYKF